MSVLLALVVDAIWGEPPVRWHPVVWMGTYLQRVGRSLPDFAPRKALLLGAAYWLLGALVVALVYAMAAALVAKLSPWLGVVVTALLLKPLFALRMLLREVAAVDTALDQDPESGRSRLRMIVSRDTSDLSAGEIRESALESLAENLSDSVIAPLLWFALLGLPGAAVYRYANTADALWGYRGRWEWGGKFAARVDDVFNLVPARLTAIALLLAGRWRWNAFAQLRREATRTPSPNAGWPMAALALSLNVRLGKPNEYVLNPSGREPNRAAVRQALRHVQRVAVMFALVLAVAMGATATSRASPVLAPSSLQVPR